MLPQGCPVHVDYHGFKGIGHIVGYTMSSIPGVTFDYIVNMDTWSISYPYTCVCVPEIHLSLVE